MFKTALPRRRAGLFAWLCSLMLMAAAPSALRAAPEAPPRASAASVVEGVLEILVEDHPTSSRTRHFLHTERGRVELQLDGKRRAPLHSGARLRVRGQLSGNLLALADGSDAGLSVIAPAQAPSTLGAQSVVVLLVNFADDTRQPYTLAQAQDVVFNQVNGFLRENSFQATWLSGASHGWLQLPIAKTCLTSEIASAARLAAGNAGIDLGGYQRFVYVFPRNDACGWSGVGTVGGTRSEVWINGRLELKVVAHELGHNFGLRHSHATDCDATPFGPNCVHQEYGDVADVMGNTSAGHFNAFQKEKLGWLNGAAQPPITAVGASGGYTVGAFETTGADAKALKIPKGIDPVSGAKTWYYVEYRRPVGYDSALASIYASNLVNGLLVRTGSDGDVNSSMLLDMTPGTVPSFDMGDAALTFGQVFSDPQSGVMLTIESADAASARVAVTLAAAGCVRAAPAVSLGGGGAGVSAGTAVSYTLSVTNRDSAGCGASTVMLSPSVPTGWSATLATTSLALLPGASATTTLTVASPLDQAAGTYAAGARAAGNASPGLVGTASGNYVITATALTVAVTTNKPSYARNDTVRMSATLQAGGTAVANASVSFTLTRPDGSSVLLSAKSDGSGTANVSYRLGRKDAAGAWQLRAGATVSGSSATAVSAFTVQ